MRNSRTIAAALLLLFGAAGCADLEVTNPNDPGRDQVLVTPSDIASLVSGSFKTWYNGIYNYNNTFWVSNASFQSASSAANYGNYDHTKIPRQAITNHAAYTDYHGMVERTWERSYRALAAVADGLRQMDADETIGEALEESEPGAERRIRAWGKTVQALAHATVAVWYDQGFVVDETTEVFNDEGNAATPTPLTYDELIEVAYGYFDEALALAEGETWSIPAEWASVEVSADELVDLLHSWRAIFRASMPRTSDEAVDWDLVLADLDDGLTSTFVMNANLYDGWYNGAFDVNGGPNGWGAETYFIIGMADTEGNYQRWLEQPVSDREPWFGNTQNEDPFLIQTPDTRFPSGTTLDDQIANPGEYYVIPTADLWTYNYNEHFTNPSRGKWRWSYYYYPTSIRYWFGLDWSVPLISTAELNLLRAEALLETDDPAGAAALVNMTRTAHGLNATDEDGTNTSCVPRLPDGTCGGLWEMLKWEKRLETKTIGLFGVGWYWDARRWGDLYMGTPLQWPIPSQELQSLQMDVYTFGGLGDGPPNASPGSSYAWPGEN